MPVKQTVKSISDSVGQARRKEPLRPFYFHVVFWGEKFRNYFLDLFLPSLLSPDNIPALTGGRTNRLLVATTQEDWEKIQQTEIFRLLETYIEPVHLGIPNPDGQGSTMWLMSQGQKAATEMAFRDRAYGIALLPDLVLSDGSVAELQRLARLGKTLVLVPALRFAMEPIVAAFKAYGWMLPGKPMELPARELMSVSLRNLHSEFLRYDWDAPYYAVFPIASYWKVTNGSGIVVHSFSWAPILIDYSSLTVHRTETFNKSTLDDDYVQKNFPNVSTNEAYVHVITDSDEFSLVSMTPEAEYTFYPLKERWEVKHWFFREWSKGNLLDEAFQNNAFDQLKRQLFLIPLKLHGGELSQDWDATVSRSEAIIWRYVSANALHRIMHRDVHDKEVIPTEGVLVVAWESGNGLLLVRKPDLVHLVLLISRKSWKHYMQFIRRVVGLIRVSPRLALRCIRAFMGDRDELWRVKRRLVRIQENFSRFPSYLNLRSKEITQIPRQRRYFTFIAFDQIEAVDDRLMLRTFWRIRLPSRLLHSLGNTAGRILELISGSSRRP
jgi:hypothetical protein